MKAPAAGELADGSTVAVQKTEFERLSGAVRQILGGDASVTYTLDAADAIKPTVSMFAVDTLGGVSSDLLQRITGEDGLSTPGLPDGSVVVLRCTSASRTVTVVHNAGGSWSINLAGSANFVLNNPLKRLVLERRGTAWYEIDRSYGGDAAAERAFLGLTSASIIANPANPGDDGKAIVASGGVLVLGTPTSTGGPAHRLLVSRTSNQTVGLSDGSTWSHVQFNSTATETSAGNLWDAGTFEVKVPSGISYIRMSLTLSVGFSVAPTTGWWVEAFSFRKSSGGSYPGNPDGHSLAGLLSTTLQGALAFGNAAYLNAQSGEIAVSSGDRLKVQLRAFAAGGGNNIVVRGTSVPAACSLSVEFHA